MKVDISPQKEAWIEHNLVKLNALNEATRTRETKLKDLQLEIFDNLNA